MSGRPLFWRLAMLMMALAMAPSLAMAAEHAGERAQPNIFEGGFHNVIWTLLIFLTVVFVLGKFAWGPLLGALKNREDFIRESLEKARKEREEADKLLERYTEQINRAREEASAITDEGRRDAEEVRRRIEGEARTEAEAIVKRAKREIEIAHHDAIRDIYDQTAELASRIAGRILEREVSADEHRQLITSTLDEFRRKGEGLDK